jgi:hypothetical protein
MAVTLSTPETKGVFDKIVSFPIDKSRTEVTPDGDLYVYGKCTDGVIDADEQIVDPDWSASALDKWFKTGANVRKQHNAREPVGKGIHIELNRDGDNGHWLRAEVVDRDAQRLVRKGVLQAFSVGIMKPKIFAHNKARGGIIKGGDIGEVSLVDRPANANCGYAIVKAAGGVAGAEPEYVGKLRGDEDILRKMLAPSPLDMPKTAPAVERGTIPDMIPSGMFASPVANRLNDALRAENEILKRDFSASQRRSAASSGDAMPDGSFPIKNGEDLGNAIHLAGHGKNPAKARAHIRRRAAALGMSNRIPDSWKSEGDIEIIDDLTSGLTEELVKQIHEGLTSIDEARKALGLPDVEEPETVGKAGSSTGADDSSDGDSSDGKKMPPWLKKPKKGKKPAAKSACPTDGSDDDDDEKDDDAGGDDDGGKAAKAAAPSSNAAGKRTRNVHADASAGPAGPPETDGSTTDDSATGPGGRNYKSSKKGKGFKCSACGAAAVKSAAFCSGCGAEFTAKRMDPAASVRGKKPTEPLPPHREPDGNVQDIEADAGLPSSKETDGRDAQLDGMGWSASGTQPGGSAIMDGSGTMGIGGGNSTSVSAAPVRAPAGTARKGAAPYALARMHDAFCAAYSMTSVLEEYPSLSKLADAVDTGDLRDSAVKAASEKDWDLSEMLLSIAREADDIVKADDDVAEDARAELHKSFTDMYPSAHPAPGSVTPGQFCRPYISAGHAPGSAQPMGSQPPGHEPPPAPAASAFTRGPLTAGQERPSPGNITDTARPKPGRMFYTNTAKTSTRTAMQAVHDHISSMYPDLCPLHAGTPVPSAMAKADGGSEDAVPADLNLQPGVMTPEDVSKAVRDALTAAGYPVTEQQLTGAYAPEGMPEVQQGRPQAAIVKAGKKTDKAYKQDAFRAEDLAEIVKAAIAPVAEKLETLSASVLSKDAEISELQKQVDQLGSMPDPAQAPNRGIVLAASNASPGGARPAERRSLVDEAAEKARDDKLRFLQSFMQSGDPGLRLQAEAQISKMLSA